MFLNTLPHAPQAHYPLQIIHYEGPPKPKQPPRRTLVPTPVELVDLTYLDDEEHSCEVSGSGSRGGDSGDVSSIDSYAPMTERESVMPAFQEDARNGASQEPPPSTGSSQGNAIFMENNQPDADADELDLHEDDEGSYMSDRLEVPNIASPEGSGFPIVTNGAIALETGNGAMNEVSQPPRGRLLSTPPASPSMMSVDQSDSRYIPMQAATHQPQRSTDEKKAEREVSLPTSESTSSSGSDIEDDDNGSKHTTSLTRKRKRPPPANSARHKRQSRRPNIHPTGRQKPSKSQMKPLSSHLSNTRLASETQSSGCGTKMRYSEDSSDESSGGSDGRGRHCQKPSKSTAIRQGSVSCARPNADNPLSTHASPHASWEMRRSAMGFSPEKAQWHLSDITFHSPSANVSFLTALFRRRGDLEILSPSRAAKLLEDVVGKAIKLDDITIKPLTPDTWFLMSLVDYIFDVAERGTGQPLSAQTSLQPNRAESASPQDYGKPSDNVDDESSSDDFDNGDENDKYSRDIVDEPSSSKKHRRWSKEEDSRLRSWKEEGKPWGWICRQFSNRSPGAVQVRWHTKLRCKA